MKFLVDANLPPGLAAWFHERGHEAIHLNDQLGLAFGDRGMFEFARQNGFAIVTKDEDFAPLATLGERPALRWCGMGADRQYHERGTAKPTGTGFPSNIGVASCSVHSAVQTTGRVKTCHARTHLGKNRPHRVEHREYHALTTPSFPLMKLPAASCGVSQN